MNFAEKTALVTGASRGIGRAIAVELARNGADVSLVGRDAKALAETAGACADARAGATAHVIRATLPTLHRSTTRLRDLERFGRLDFAVANAGQSVDALLLRLREDAVDQMLSVNLKSAIFLCSAAAKPMMKQRSGSIVLVSSIVGMMGNAGQAAYAASKAGPLRPVQVGCKGVGFEEYKSQRRRAGPHRDRHDRKHARWRQGDSRETGRFGTCRQAGRRQRRRCLSVRTPRRS